ncbi:MAG: response regulator transcription factor [Bradyrhizobium sp.]|jgi:DNA-binding NarL/FixJ family response regulator
MNMTKGHCADYWAANQIEVQLPLRIEIISDIRFTRESLSELLPRDGVLSILGSFAGLEEALVTLRQRQPQIVMIDEALPGGRAAIGQIRAEAPEVLVVVMAVTETAEKIVTWAELGAAGYIPKTAALADIAPALLNIAGGRQACTENVAAGLMRRLSMVGPAAGKTRKPMPALLTTRERQIAQLVASGLSNKDIARHLNIGLATTKTHVHHLLAKLNLERRGQAASWLNDHGNL